MKTKDATAPDGRVFLKDLELPQQLRELDERQCVLLCKEIRGILVNTVSKTGGHLASNLGVVELTLALHRCFDSPNDKIIWDVGHQSYTHKLLTGRLSEFSTLRRENGISGFPKPSESAHDAFVSGHSSTSVSVACGFAEGMRIAGNKDNFAVAVIGDGAFTGGMVYEAMNNVGKTMDNIIIVLNHNNMSISKNVGSMAKYFTQVRSSNDYVKKKFALEKKLTSKSLGIPVYKFMRSSKAALKRIMIKPTIFDDLGFIFLGPVDGHNISDIEDALNAAKTYHRPVVVQVNTVKGKGYPPAEANPGEYHGISKFDIETGNPEVSSENSFSVCFGEELVRLAENDSRICAVTAAMKYGTGLQFFAKQYPERFFDVGIAEQHAVTFSSALSKTGYIPVFAVYSSFLQRSFDQLVHDASLGEAHLVLGVDRAGIVGEDGETHQGIFDVPMLSSVPNTVIYSPVNFTEVRRCLFNAVYCDSGISCLRYPRGGETDRYDDKFITANYCLDADQGATLLLVSYGRITAELISAANTLRSEGTPCAVLKLTKIHPISDELLRLCARYKSVVFFEEGSQNGGICEHFASGLLNMGFCGTYHSHAIKGYIKQAKVSTVLDNLGFTAEKMLQSVREAILSRENKTGCCNGEQRSDIEQTAGENADS